jgi:hypothetical protein
MSDAARLLMPNRCWCCGTPEEELTDFALISNGRIEVLLCLACARDYVVRAGETIGETLDRARCDPRAALRRKVIS